MATKYVLVDFENVQLKNVGDLNGSALKIKVFLGASQVKVPLDIARALQAFGRDVDYIQIDGNGSNALDFHIAFYIGRLAAQAPDASDLPRAISRRSSDDGATWFTADDYVYAPGHPTRAGRLTSDPQGNVYAAHAAEDAQGSSHWIVRKLACD